MASTYTSLHYHLVFSTKDRGNFIAPEWRGELHRYMGGVVRGLDGIAEGVGGVADHVHLLVSLKPTHCLSDFMRELKKSSSAWTQAKDRAFGWQDGYSAFSVSATGKQGVLNYIANQEEHHRVKSFREELVELLDRAGITYNPKYLD